MKKSFEVNLGGRIFNFDEDAYELLNNYMESLKECFSKQDGGEEIIADIEVAWANCARHACARERPA